MIAFLFALAVIGGIAAVVLTRVLCGRVLSWLCRWIMEAE